MLVSDRRRFLRSSAATSLALTVPADLFAQAASVSAPASATGMPCVAPFAAGRQRYALPNQGFV